LLTLDLVPGSDALWNFSEGLTIEDESVHGDLTTFLAEIAACRLVVKSVDVVRDIPDSRTDIALIKAVADN
jgi:hypothetical protein